MHLIIASRKIAKSAGYCAWIFTENRFNDLYLTGLRWNFLNRVEKQYKARWRCVWNVCTEGIVEALGPARRLQFLKIFSLEIKAKKFESRAVVSLLTRTWGWWADSRSALYAHIWPVLVESILKGVGCWLLLRSERAWQATSLCSMGLLLLTVDYRVATGSCI